MLDYNTHLKSTGQIVSLYAGDEFRASDHDAVIAGLQLGVSETRGFRLVVPSRRIFAVYHKSVRDDPREYRLGRADRLDREGRERNENREKKSRIRAYFHTPQRDRREGRAYLLYTPTLAGRATGRPRPRTCTSAAPRLRHQSIPPPCQQRARRMANGQYLA